jgi:dihydroorotate dehydrogenase electron transfer subunit
MKINTTPIHEIAATLNGRAIRVSNHPSRTPEPGEYFLAFASDSVQTLPTAIFPYEIEPESLTLCGNIPSEWQPGTSLYFQGPLGKGFHPSPIAGKIALLATDSALSDRLYALMNLSLSRGLAVAWVSDAIPERLPPQVELLGSSELIEAVIWSDYTATTASLTGLGTLLHKFARHADLKKKVEVLIDAPMVCGNARCGVCAVETKKGWKLACKDGPVFNLEEVIGD